MFGFKTAIDASKINKEVKAGQALLLDVRSKGEYSSSRASDSTHFSLDRIDAGELPTTDTSIKLYVYCASGARSSMAASILQRHGFEVVNIGGLRSWVSAGGGIS